MKDAWVQVTPSEYQWEREALDFLKNRLPGHEPYRAWANFEFPVDGTVSDVDVLSSRAGALTRRDQELAGTDRGRRRNLAVGAARRRRAAAPRQP